MPLNQLDITPEQERQWREQGFTVVDGFDVSEARAAAKFDDGSTHGDFGSKGGSFEFPTGILPLDCLPIRLMRVAQRLLSDESVLLSQADIWIKKPKKRTPASNDDQRMHCDFGNNIMFVPEWHTPVAMAAIIYLDGHDECRGGGTAAVPRLGPDDPAYAREKILWMPGYGNRPWINNRQDAEAWFEKHAPEERAFRQKLYEREKYIDPMVGRVLLYRLDVWHRGTPLYEGSRRVMNLVYFSSRAVATGGRWNSGFWKLSYDISPQKVYSAPDKLFEKLTPEERVAVGVPPPGHPFWTEEMLKLVQLRFPGFDPTPYRLVQSRQSVQQSSKL